MNVKKIRADYPYRLLRNNIKNKYTAQLHIKNTLLEFTVPLFEHQIEIFKKLPNCILNHYFKVAKAINNEIEIRQNALLGMVECFDDELKLLYELSEI